MIEAVVTNFEGNTNKLRIMGGTIEHELNNSIPKLRFMTKNVINNLGLKKVYIDINNNICFYGKVKTQNITPFGALDEVRFEAFDYLDIANHRIVAENYSITNGPYKIQDILIDITSKYLPEITYNNIQAIDNEIEAISFDYETLYSCYKKLADICGAYFYIDSSLDFHFFINNEGITDKVYDESNVRLNEGFEIDIENTKIANRIWVIGAKQASPNYKEQIYNFDGLNRIFTLGYEPNYVLAYSRDSTQDPWVEKNIGEEKNYDGSQDLIYNKAEKNVSIPDDKVIPSNGQLKIKYRPTEEFIDYYENLSSQNKYGLYEVVIRDKTIKSLIEARRKTRLMLRKRSYIIRTITFLTPDWQGYNIGKIITLKLDRYSINNYFTIVARTINLNTRTSQVLAQMKVQEVLKL